jgi:hypothetical protein
MKELRQCLNSVSNVSPLLLRLQFCTANPEVCNTACTLSRIQEMKMSSSVGGRKGLIELGPLVLSTNPVNGHVTELTPMRAKAE